MGSDTWITLENLDFVPVPRVLFIHLLYFLDKLGCSFMTAAPICPPFCGASQGFTLSSTIQVYLQHIHLMFLSPITLAIG